MAVLPDAVEVDALFEVDDGGRRIQTVICVIIIIIITFCIVLALGLVGVKGLMIMVVAALIVAVVGVLEADVGVGEYSGDFC